MGTAEQQDEQEKQQAISLVSEVTPFLGVESMRVEFDNDFTGDPSMWIVFRLKEGFKGDEPWVRAFAEHTTKLRFRLLNSGLARFPYTRLERTA